MIPTDLPTSFDLSPSILAYRIPKVAAEGHTVKKQKTETENDTIEARLANQYYSSTHHLLTDLRYVLSELKKSSSQVNGLSNGDSKLPSPLDFSAIENLLSQYSHTASSPTTVKMPSSTHAGQVITLRSNDAGLVKQLFTGLRKVLDSKVKLEEIDIRKLPSGFEIVDAAVPDTLQSNDTDSRIFGDVYRPARNLRPLDPPKSSRGSKENVLNFIKPFENYGSTNKDDYRLVSLSAGNWLEYAVPDQELAKFPSQGQTAVKKDPISLFKATFSSFAPVQDSSSAVVSNSDRSRQWFRKYGDQVMRNGFGTPPSDEWENSTYPEIDDDYQQLIDTFIPTPEEEPKTIPAVEEDDDKDVLEEISDLLQTLSSYQHLRDLDRNRVFAANIKPAGPEIDIYNLLRQQLELLVSALPPFAVAKLNGDQLEALNISTNIVVTTPDVAGTGQPDEGSLQRVRQLQAQQQPSVRPVQSRNSYTTATPAVSYNAQARSYNSNVATTPSMPGYAQRGAQMYNTPRPNIAASTPVYNQIPYQQRPQQPFPGATIQQFQRMQNGYTQNNQTPYQPRATPASYQPQIQSSSQQYGRPSSPAKALVNGTTQPQQMQQYRNSYSTPASTSLLQGPYAQANAHATIQQVKAAHQMQQQQTQQSHSQSPQPQAMQSIQQQRQGSGTPQPQLQPRSQSQSSISNAAGSAVNGIASQTQQGTRSTPTPTPAVGAGA
ncbi:hypothetical protein ES702_01128 [subsurface metagenome]